jgi:hypothetical protein
MNTKLSINNTENTQNHAENTGGQSHENAPAAPPESPAAPPSHDIATPIASAPVTDAPDGDDAPVSHWVRLPQNPNRPRSNIARLSRQAREMVNVALREGMDYREIIIRIGAMAGKDHGVTPSMLSRWFKTGYKDWLRQTTHLEDTIAQSDAALTRLARLKSETGADLSDLLETFLASLLQKTLQDFDPAALKALLADKPAEIFRLISCLNANIAVRSSRQHAEIARVRCHIQVAEKEKAARVEPIPAKKLYEAEFVRHGLEIPFEQRLSDLVSPARHKKIDAELAAANALKTPKRNSI